MDEGTAVVLGLVSAAQYILEDAREVSNSAGLGSDPYDHLGAALHALSAAEDALRVATEDDSE